MPTDRICLCCSASDKRRGINSLARMVQQVLTLDPHTGAIFCFRGQRAHCLKQNVTNSVAVPNGMVRCCHPDSEDGWQGGSAWRHGRNWWKQLSSGIDRGAEAISASSSMSSSR
ncbi:IS66 family insertion sequence element accessory protein TnpB [Mesorhizobium sp.]|uniref:IS66 family insertion sequence element accessory protein TnpB n=1 Tax=Mesorhizobium sp. TaxID=1871066 RepID=UPI00338D4E2A